MRRFSRRIRVSASAIVAVLLLLFVVGGFLAFGVGGGGETGSGVLIEDSRDGVSYAQLHALRVGMSRNEVERQVGHGEGALEYWEAGGVVEPMDADCVYLPLAQTNNVRRSVQLCFREGELTSKRTFLARYSELLIPPGA